MFKVTGLKGILGYDQGVGQLDSQVLKSSTFWRNPVYKKFNFKVTGSRSEEALKSEKDVAQLDQTKNIYAKFKLLPLLVTEI